VNASSAPALVSYYFVETPIRKKKIFKTRNTLFYSVWGVVLFVSVGLWGSFYYEIGNKKYPSYINSTSIPYKSYEPDNYFLINESWELQKEISGIPIFTVSNVEKDRGTLFPMNSKKEKLLVVGNSHSVDFYNVLFFSNKIKKQFELARFGIQIQNINKEFYSTPNYKAADVIALCSLMNMKDLKVLKEIIKKLNEDGKRVFVCQNIFSWMKRSNYTKLDRLVIKGALNGKNEISLSNEINSIYTDEYINRQFMTSERKKVFEYMEKLLIELLNELEFKILNRMDYVCNNQNCEIVSANVEKYFFDGGHHTLSGARHFGKRIDENGIADIIIAQ